MRPSGSKYHSGEKYIDPSELVKSETPTSRPTPDTSISQIPQAHGSQASYASNYPTSPFGGQASTQSPYASTYPTSYPPLGQAPPIQSGAANHYSPSPGSTYSPSTGSTSYDPGVYLAEIVCDGAGKSGRYKCGVLLQRLWLKKGSYLIKKPHYKLHGGKLLKTTYTDSKTQKVAATVKPLVVQPCGWHMGEWEIDPEYKSEF